MGNLHGRLSYGVARSIAGNCIQPGFLVDLQSNHNVVCTGPGLRRVCGKAGNLTGSRMSGSDTFPYIGDELDLFALAHRWKAYWISHIGRWVRGDVLEVGAGL